MAISFTTLFNGLGKIFAAHRNVLQVGGNIAPTASAKWGTSGPVIKDQATMYSDWEGKLAASGFTGLLPSSQFLAQLLALDQALNSLKGAAVTDAKAYLTQTVQNDTPQPNANLQSILVETIRQMRAQTITVNQSTIGSSVTAGSNNTGNPSIVVGSTDQNGYATEYALPETIVFRVTSDQRSGATAGSEPLAFFAPAQQQPNSYLYYSTPGSGISGTIPIVDPTINSPGGTNVNFLSGGTTTTGAFKAWSGGAPTGWTANVDAANVADGTSDAYAGAAHCLSFVGNTAGSNLQTEVYQNFANGSVAGGSGATLLPNTCYLFAMRLKVKTVPAAGAISVSLTDGSGTVLNDNAGNANTITQSLTGLTNNTYVLVSGTFRTPTAMPANCRIRIKATTPITTASTAYMDYVALILPTQQSTPLVGGLYPGGPFIAAFRGSTDVVKWLSYSVGDTWNVAITNSLFSGAAPSVQITMDQIFGMRGLGLILPSSGSPSIADSVIA